VTTAWSDVLERVAEGQVDDAASAKNMSYLQNLLQTAAMGATAAGFAGRIVAIFRHNIVTPATIR
jgi:hypothetical protein